ncbi:cytidine deaminase [Desertivirga xinjiangensis]|uniref:cytidine deaminase n=1 Tax=Desertivirga xinjiangensis TaxID=539206 RepID=UPI00210BDC8E|nr:cytidine deaminase [Pedobacter xinjiangensis]
MVTEKTLSIAFHIYNTIAELGPEDKQLCLEAEKALNSSYSPYSGFRVGAAILLESGKIIHGSNQENAAFPSGLCAERAALFNFGSNYPNEKITHIAITSYTDKFVVENPVTPCGACLQVLAEYERKQVSEIEVLLYCLNGAVWKIKGAKAFLPFLFFENRLNRSDDKTA